ncbi:MerR family transcriptional regulator [Paenibacillus durus]|uniref:HTH merR-type domain-containing protein n=1 Tax=Paenibacillus durus ATCC 35681 TaxID=1333534 RepID=A0A0F7CH02_PAEDU|nr:MerR family transcriptional regulator [Paenibacillus durus]AKG33365.1 hypothetical protein VK70_01030 [Paenibacillus durus ATCC 35681]
MRIHEICKECNVTKKAVEYYEKQGLINPRYDSSNYRSFDHDDVIRIKEIAMLRKLNISIADIKIIIASDDRHAALSKYKMKKELQMQQMRAQYDCLIDFLENGYNLEQAIDTVSRRLDSNMAIKDRLLQAFPGTYGMYLYVHFGRFLNEKLNSDEQKLAYYKMVEFLDHVNDMEFPRELEQFLAKAFDSMSETDLQQIDDSMNRAVEDYSNFITENRESIEQYLAYRNSDEHKSSSVYKMQQLLIEFQQSSGYYDVFIHNLQILSSSYRKYQDQLRQADKEFFNQYPDAENGFGNK